MHRDDPEWDVHLYAKRIADLHAEVVDRGARVVQAATPAPHGLLEFVVEDADAAVGRTCYASGPTEGAPP